jgi:hypothetical protein
MGKDHPLLSELVDLADSVDMATMVAERGNDADRASSKARSMVVLLGSITGRSCSWT